jgi:hypothetical protein
MTVGADFSGVKNKKARQILADLSGLLSQCRTNSIGGPAKTALATIWLAKRRQTSS